MKHRLCVDHFRTGNFENETSWIFHIDGYELRYATLKGRNKKVKVDLEFQHGNGAAELTVFHHAIVAE